jgi:hypothetical protein
MPLRGDIGSGGNVVVVVVVVAAGAGVVSLTASVVSTGASVVNCSRVVAVSSLFPHAAASVASAARSNRGLSGFTKGECIRGRETSELPGSFGEYG